MILSAKDSISISIDFLRSVAPDVCDWLLRNTGAILEITGGALLQLLGWCMDGGTLYLSVQTCGGTLVLTPVVVPASTTLKVTGAVMMGHGGAMLAQSNSRNPNGRNGGQLHQDKISQTIKEKQDEGWIFIRKEKWVATPNGSKTGRFGDILMRDPEGNEWIIQVGKQTKGGFPISRESAAIRDLEAQGWKVIFIPYN